MTFRSFLALACCTAALVNSAPAAPRPGDSQLRDDLDVAYNTWRLHMLRGNYDGWRATTSAYRQVKVRNLAVSEKRPFPASLFMSLYVALVIIWILCLMRNLQKKMHSRILS